MASAKDYPGTDYDLVATFDCLHDMGDPVGAARHMRETLAPDGTWLIVEPFANDALADNLNPVGKLYYAASTMVCTPASLSQEVGLGLGAQAGETRLATRGRRGRLHPLPACHRDPLQPHPGGATVAGSAATADRFTHSAGAPACSGGTWTRTAARRGRNR